MSTMRSRRLPRLGRRSPAGRSARRLPRPGPRLVLSVLVLALVLLGAFLWLRQSSLVAVRRVTVTGVSGPDAARIRGALTGAARGMSTLDIDAHRLHVAVAPFPVVRSLRLHAEVPHGLRIAVDEQVPVAVLLAGGERTLLATDGTLLHIPATGQSLPTITTKVVPGGARVTGSLLADVRMLAAAPYPLLARIASAGTSSGRLTASLRDGPTLVFGSSASLRAKWRAAVAVLASSSSAGASYIDVSDPARPAAGAGPDAAPGPSASPSAKGPSVQGANGVSSPSSTG